MKGYELRAGNDSVWQERPKVATCQEIYTGKNARFGLQLSVLSEDRGRQGKSHTWNPSQAGKGVRLYDR